MLWQNPHCTKCCCLIFIIISSTWKQSIKASPEIPFTPIRILSQFSGAVTVSCHEKITAAPPSRLVPFATESLDFGEQWLVDFGRSIFDNMLFCAFEAKIRKCNCAEELRINTLCVWESPWSFLSRGSVHNDDACPQCDQGAHHEVRCEWAIPNGGLYLKEYDPNTGENFHIPRASWVNQDPNHENENVFEFSIANEIDNVVKVICPLWRFPVPLPARSAVAEEARTWRVKLDVLDDLNLFSTWRCDLEISATGQNRRGVRIWTPPDEELREGKVRDPPCVDCAWRLDADGFWLDRRDCLKDWPDREHVYNWIWDDGTMGRWNCLKRRWY